jgi:hypothetical protein
VFTVCYKLWHISLSKDQCAKILINESTINLLRINTAYPTSIETIEFYIIDNHILKSLNKNLIKLRIGGQKLGNSDLFVMLYM